LAEFHSAKPVSVIETVDDQYAILYYLNGSNRGEVGCKMIGHDEDEATIINDGLKYWTWKLKGGACLDDLVIKDYAVLLPKVPVASEAASERVYTMVTKEWSPAMFEHFEYSRVGTSSNGEKRMLYEVDQFGIVNV
jgi:hypothetical protein